MKNNKLLLLGLSACAAGSVLSFAQPAQAAFLTYTELSDAPGTTPGQATGINMGVNDFFTLSGQIGNGDLMDAFEFTYTGPTAGDLSFGLGVVPTGSAGQLGFEIFKNGVSVLTGTDPASGLSLGTFNPGDLVGVKFTAPTTLGASGYTSNFAATEVPTPALLPAMFGLGAAAWHKRKKQVSAVDA